MRLCFSMLLLSWIGGTIQAQDKTIALFNGKDLSNFYTYLVALPGSKEPLGRNNDPKNVFRVVQEEGKPALRISGEVWGGITTEKEYENYKLIVEFKWGTKTFGSREKAARDSGILVHCTGEDAEISNTWMASIECQMIEGGTGDLLVLPGKGKKHKLTTTVEYRPTGKSDQPYFKEDGKAVEFTAGRINWWGRDPNWKDQINYRGPKDVEKPVGEWNTIECLCNQDTITVHLNGQLVNKATKVFPTKGKIQIQSEGAEVFFRKIELQPIK